jgi:hypothetical protein
MDQSGSFSGTVRVLARRLSQGNTPAAAAAGINTSRGRYHSGTDM